MRKVRKGGGHGCTKFVGFGEDVSVKERFAYDTQSEVGHLPIDINHSPISPGLLDTLAVIAHAIGITDHMAWLERWSHELTLVTVKITLAREEAIPDYRREEAMDGYAFVEVIGMFDQNAVNVL